MAGIASIIKLKENAQRIVECVAGGVWIKEIVEKNEAEICDLNSVNQLFEKGENALGVSIEDYMPYSPKTIAIKAMKGQPTDRVTLKDTGDFHASFFIEADNEKFTLSATDEKTDELVKKYGSQIFGLNEENKAYVANELILPELINKTKQTLWQQ